MLLILLGEDPRAKDSPRVTLMRLPEDHEEDRKPALRETEKRRQKRDRDREMRKRV
jgi:hypothetical protein